MPAIKKTVSLRDKALSNAKKILGEGKLDEAIKSLKEIETWKTDASVLELLADIEERKAEQTYFVGEKNEHLREAISFYKKALDNQTQNNDSCQLSIALCYKKLGSYVIAIDSLLAIKNWQSLAPVQTEIKNIGSLLVEPYQTTNKELLLLLIQAVPGLEFKRVIAYLKQIPDWEQDKNVLKLLNKGDFLLNLALSEEEKNNPIKALKFLQLKNKWKESDQYRFVGARLYIQAKDYQGVIDLLASKTLSEDESLFLAEAYQQLENFDSAIATLKKIDGWNTRARVLPVLAHNYSLIKKTMERDQIVAIISSQAQMRYGYAKFLQKTGEFTEAAVIYETLSSKSLSTIKALVLCYENMGNDEKAANLIETIKNRDKQFYLLKGGFLRKKGLFAEAIAMYQQIGDWENNSKALSSIAECHIAQYNYEEALACLQKVPDQSSWVLDRIAYCQNNSIVPAPVVEPEAVQEEIQVSQNCCSWFYQRLRTCLVGENNDALKLKRD